MVIFLNYLWVNVFVKYFDYDKLFFFVCLVCLLLENFIKKFEIFFFFFKSNVTLCLKFF